MRKYLVIFPRNEDGNGGYVAFHSPRALVQWLKQHRHRLPRRLYGIREIGRGEG